MSDFRPQTPRLLADNAVYAQAFDAAGLPAPPSRRIAVVACMDARMDVYRILGLGDGEAHVIRNAGGVVSDDVIRSLCLSQRLLGTREVVLVHHTKCGMQMIDEQGFLAELEAETGVRPDWAVQAFTDPHVDVVESMQRLQASPFLPHTDRIRGFVYDIDDGRLYEAAVVSS
ncbi:MAG: carbonic anhydrase [Acidimicrobiaceae bacterium]|nr:carbonic anhydrase [Acidimicrobiaceae bacterium]MCY4175714.1 carbonic anhydrase [Acidimicrobiaceae bacterium]MCY4279543.1 carbonic anhydrase [Acidimicrobiaceae bacterium]MCY4295124.1 carbonic anhydrase [Acidimicrobiaceae bacterium]